MREESRNISFLSYVGASKVDTRNSSVVKTGRLRQAIQNRKKIVKQSKKEIAVTTSHKRLFNET